LDKCFRAAGTAAMIAVVPVLSLAVEAAELPKATKDMLAKLKMDASVLKGLDQELKVPADWIARARKEKSVRYYGNFSRAEWPIFYKPFQERYPSIKISHSRTSRTGRVEKPLIAFKEGRVFADIIAAIGPAIKLFREAGALTDLRDIPNFTLAHPDMRDKGGLWVGEKLKYWCMAYNTGLLKEKNLPKRWEDILTNKALHKGNIGISNRPHNWILPIWNAKGGPWTQKYINGLFSTARPQLRKEGARALVVLAIAGEFHAAIPATPYRVAEYAKKGAPVGWHCPEPVPVTISTLVVIKGGRAPYAAKVFMNWFLSKEGQMAQYFSTKASPVHKDLQDKGLVQFGHKIKGRKIALRTPESLINVFPAVLKIWNKGWSKAGGPMAATTVSKVKTVLTSVKRGGRRLAFKVGGGEHKAKVSRSRTEILIGGKASSRGKLKPGMKCDIAYLGNGNEARKVSCK
jgi:iron(III) transport system substrate-binding protein